MTEFRIFQILLENDKEICQNQFDYPKLHPNSVDLIANSFTDIIYDTLKTKGSSATNRRHDVLKYLQTLTTNIDNHLSIRNENCHLFFDSLQNIYTEGFDNDFNAFSTKIEAELRQIVPQNLCETVLSFNRRRDETRCIKMKTLENIKKHDQELLDKANFPMKSTKDVFIESKENLIKSVLKQTNSTLSSNVETNEYREKQIKFAYALFNLKKIDFLLLIVQKLSQYNNLIEVESNFVTFLGFCLDNSSNSNKIRCLLAEKFSFVYEKIIVEHGTIILPLELPDLDEYFQNLIFDKKIETIKEIAEKNELFRTKLRNLLYCLYYYSYCNSNVLKFNDFLF